MPPPEPEEEPRPKPEPKPKPKPPKPKKAPEPGPKPKPMPARPVPRRDVTPGDGGSSPPELFCRDNCSGPCTLIPHCQPLPPPSAGTALKLTSSRLPTPLIAVSASLLVVCAVLLLALLVRCLVQRRRRMRAQNWPLAQHGEEGGQPQVLAGAVAGDVRDEDEELAADGSVHHVWYIRTKGLDERAIAAIAAVVYDAKKRGAVGGRDGDASCAVCLADFRDGETLRLLPRCGHAFHRGCIDTWLRAHVNCPLCRAPVQAASAAAPAPGTAAAAAAPRGEGDANLAAVGGVRTEQETARSGAPERAVRRAASMVALPRRAWPDLSFRAPTSNSGREEDMSGLGKIMRLLKLSDSLEMSGGGAGTRSVSFSAGSCQRLPTRSGPSAAGGSAEETSQ